MLRVALFDLDDTLYSRASGLWPAIGQRINQYMVERLGLAADVAAGLRQRYLETFGTTLNGLRQEFGIDAGDYLAYVHDLPLERYLEPSPELNRMLARLPLRKIIFTNADAAHARRVTARLGVADHFERIVDVHTLNFLPKPDPRAYAQVLALIGAEPAECILVDDAPRNLWPAHALGMLAVLVSRAGGPLPAGVDHQIDSILDLEPLLAHIDSRLAAERQAEP
jgi:putative hydrolase of the HAD superfamily